MAWSNCNRPECIIKFTAFPAGRIPAEFKGLGSGKIVEMKAEVEVKRYIQPNGPGTQIRFSAADINGDAALRRIYRTLYSKGKYKWVAGLPHIARV